MRQPFTPGMLCDDKQPSISLWLTQRHPTLIMKNKRKCIARKEKSCRSSYQLYIFPLAMPFYCNCVTALPYRRAGPDCRPLMAIDSSLRSMHAIAILKTEREIFCEKRPPARTNIPTHTHDTPTYIHTQIYVHAYTYIITLHIHTHTNINAFALITLDYKPYEHNRYNLLPSLQNWIICLPKYSPNPDVIYNGLY